VRKLPIAETIGHKLVRVAPVPEKQLINK